LRDAGDTKDGTMLRVWGRVSSANVQKVLWCCAELDLAYERIDVGGPFGGLQDPKYLALNPNGLIPTVEDDGFVLWESNTIVRYLAAKYGAGGLCPVSVHGRAEAERWMDWHLCHFLPSVAVVFFGLVRTPPEQRDIGAIEAARRQTGTILEVLNSHLSGRDYVAGRQLTMGDIAIGGWVHRWFAMDIERPKQSHLEAWYRRLSTREPYRAQVMAVPL
jgi:glutathione S-transferase